MSANKCRWSIGVVIGRVGRKTLRGGATHHNQLFLLSEWLVFFALLVYTTYIREVFHT